MFPLLGVGGYADLGNGNRLDTITVKGKRKLARGKRYTRSDFKKAIVTLEEGHQIDITTGL